MNLILDIGCGHNPNAKANIFLEKHLTGLDQRAEEIQNFPKNLVAGDVEHLPFKDKVFCYCYCSQVLEHVEEPDLALSEIERVARAGVIETPHLFNELTIGKPFHRWLVIKKGYVLIFIEKDEAEDMPFKRLLYEPIYGNKAVREVAERAGLVDCVYEWSGCILAIVINKHGRLINNMEV